MECYAIKLNEKGEKSVVQLEFHAAAGDGIPEEVDVIKYLGWNYYRREPDQNYGKKETVDQFLARILYDSRIPLYWQSRGNKLQDRAWYEKEMDRQGIPVWEREPPAEE